MNKKDDQGWNAFDQQTYLSELIGSSTLENEMVTIFMTIDTQTDTQPALKTETYTSQRNKCTAQHHCS